jgi:PTS system nitrogen regulatory IIA component
MGIKLSSLSKYLWPEDIILDLEVKDKQQLFNEIGRVMEKEHGLSLELLVAGLSRREKLGSTGLGEGVAIPHARMDGLKKIQLCYIRLKTPITFDAPDGKPVSDIIVILVPKQATDEHLQILAETTQIFSDERFRERLHLCRHALEVQEMISTYSW